MLLQQQLMVVDTAPAALNTLNELAAALGDDANYASTITNALAAKVDKTSLGKVIIGQVPQGETVGSAILNVYGNIFVKGTVDGVDISQLATTVDTNSDKVGITTAQADEITANTAKTGITSGEQTKLGHITVTKAANLDTMGSNISTNNDKVGITTAQADEITANTAKTGITSAEQTKLGHITVTKATDLDTIQSNVATNNDKVGITTAQADEITANTAKTGITRTNQITN